MSFNPQNFYLERQGNIKLRRAKDEKKMIQFLSDSTIIGRSLGSNIVTWTKRTSKSHCEISFRGGRMFLKDLNSAAGTYINGNKIRGAEYEILLNDLIGLGYNPFNPKHQQDPYGYIFKVLQNPTIELDSDDEEDSDVELIGEQVVPQVASNDESEQQIEENSEEVAESSKSNFDFPPLDLDESREIFDFPPIETADDENERCEEVINELWISNDMRRRKSIVERNFGGEIPNETEEVQNEPQEDHNESSDTDEEFNETTDAQNDPEKPQSDAEEPTDPQPSTSSPQSPPAPSTSTNQQHLTSTPINYSTVIQKKNQEMTAMRRFNMPTAILLDEPPKSSKVVEVVSKEPSTPRKSIRSAPTSQAVKRSPKPQPQKSPSASEASSSESESPAPQAPVRQLRRKSIFEANRELPENIKERETELKRWNQPQTKLLDEPPPIRKPRAKTAQVQAKPVRKRTAKTPAPAESEQQTKRTKPNEDQEKIEKAKKIFETNKRAKRGPKKAIDRQHALLNKIH